jgi:hypothetical protein
LKVPYEGATEEIRVMMMDKEMMISREIAAAMI